MSNLIEKLRELLGRATPATSNHVAVPLDDHSVERLMHLLSETRDDELSCEEVFNCLDEYVECLESHDEDVGHGDVGHGDVGGKKPLVEHHLSICPDCRDELHALIHALENAQGE